MVGLPGGVVGLPGGVVGFPGGVVGFPGGVVGFPGGVVGFRPWLASVGETVWPTRRPGGLVAPGCGTEAQ
jgi:suppressor of tumorigenicity protein 13